MIRTRLGREEVLAKNELPGQKQPQAIHPESWLWPWLTSTAPGPTEGVRVHLKGVGSTQERGSIVTPSVPWQLLCRSLRLDDTSCLPWTMFLLFKNQIYAPSTHGWAHAGQCSFQPPCCNLTCLLFLHQVVNPVAQSLGHMQSSS